MPPTSGGVPGATGMCVKGVLLSNAGVTQVCSAEGSSQPTICADSLGPHGGLGGSPGPRGNWLLTSSFGHAGACPTQFLTRVPLGFLVPLFEPDLQLLSLL